MIQVNVNGRLHQAQVPAGYTEFYVSVDNSPPCHARLSSAVAPTVDPDIEKAIPCIINMISGCADAQESADVFDTTTFGLPKTMGRAGGACTSALLEVLYKFTNDSKGSNGVSWVDILKQMRAILLNMGA